MLNPIFIDALKKRLAVHGIQWPGSFPDNGFTKHTQNFGGGPTYSGGFAGGGNFQGGFQGGGGFQGLASHAAATPGVPLADGGATGDPAASAGLSWLPGYVPNEGYDTTGLTPFNTSPQGLFKHGAYGTLGEDPMTAAIRARNAMRTARGNTTPWAPPAGYQFAPGSWQSKWRPGVAPSFDPTTGYSW